MKIRVALILLILFSCLVSGEAGAVDLKQRQRLFHTLFTEPCLRFQVPKALALAIARQESGFQPWAVNVGGKSFFGGSKVEALRIAERAWRQGRSFDVGLMQVNVAWLKRYGISLETALDPQANVLIGVWILSKEIYRHGLSWQAVAYYHTPLHKNYSRGRNYARSVLRQMERILADG